MTLQPIAPDLWHVEHEIFEGDGRAALIAALPRVIGRAALVA